MNLTTLFGHLHKFVSFEFFLFVKNRPMLLVQVIANLFISGDIGSWRSACLRSEQRLAGLRVYIF
jgi:hypothetical protein